MSTTLASQLQQISKTWKADQAPGRASLLFSPQEAAERGAADAYKRGRQGACLGPETTPP